MPKNNQTWYSMSAINTHVTIYIYEEIGFWGVTSACFAKELTALGDISTITRSTTIATSDVYSTTIL